MLEAHMHLLTNAIVGATYAGTITGFEEEAKERAEIAGGRVDVLAKNEALMKAQAEVRPPPPHEPLSGFD